MFVADAVENGQPLKLCDHGWRNLLLLSKPHIGDLELCAIRHVAQVDGHAVNLDRFNGQSQFREQLIACVHVVSEKMKAPARGGRGMEKPPKRSLRVGDCAADLHAEVGIDDLINAARLAELLAVAVEAGEDRAGLVRDDERRRRTCSRLRRAQRHLTGIGEAELTRTRERAVVNQAGAILLASESRSVTSMSLAWPSSPTRFSSCRPGRRRRCGTARRVSCERRRIDADQLKRVGTGAAGDSNFAVDFGHAGDGCDGDHRAIGQTVRRRGDDCGVSLVIAVMFLLYPWCRLSGSRPAR